MTGFGTYTLNPYANDSAQEGIKIIKEEIK